jgi:hypothetical protein
VCAAKKKTSFLSSLIATSDKTREQITIPLTDAQRKAKAERELLEKVERERRAKYKTWCGRQAGFAFGRAPTSQCRCEEQLRAFLANEKKEHIEFRPPDSVCKSILAEVALGNLAGRPGTGRNKPGQMASPIAGC